MFNKWMKYSGVLPRVIVVVIMKFVHQEKQEKISANRFLVHGFALPAQVPENGL
jgi:hypothetical protein